LIVLSRLKINAKGGLYCPIYHNEFHLNGQGIITLMEYWLAVSGRGKAGDNIKAQRLGGIEAFHQPDFLITARISTADLSAQQYQ